MHRHLMIQLIKPVKNIARTLLVSIMRYVISQPALKKIASTFLSKFPRIRAHVNLIAFRARLSVSPGYSGYTTGLWQPDRVIAAHNANEALSSHDISQFTDKKITDIDYFDLKIPQRISQYYNLGFDFDLIANIRDDHKIGYAIHSGDRLQSTIAHVFLALLYRQPSLGDIQQYSNIIIKSNDFEPLITAIFNSPEFEIRGRKGLIS